MSGAAKPTKPTPGPWKVIDVLGSVSVYAGQKEIVRYCNRVVYEDRPSTSAELAGSDPENKANCRLIAASWSLAQALKALRRDCMDAEPWMDDMDSTSGTIRESLRSSIAKAGAALQAAGIEEE